MQVRTVLKIISHTDPVSLSRPSCWGRASPAPVPAMQTLCGGSWSWPPLNCTRPPTVSMKTERENTRWAYASKWYWNIYSSRFSLDAECLHAQTQLWNRGAWGKTHTFHFSNARNEEAASYTPRSLPLQRLSRFGTLEDYLRPVGVFHPSLVWGHLWLQWLLGFLITVVPVGAALRTMQISLI